MSTVIFDFDSTLITCESLEEVLREKKLDDKQMQNIQEITNEGMSGRISFLESLTRRLSLATLSRNDFIAFGNRAAGFLTPGIAELVRELQDKGVEVWIVSGALIDVLKPLAKKIGIPEEHVLGVDLLWSDEGVYIGVDHEVPINISKWQGAWEKAKSWSVPAIAVGDGMTDYALYANGLVDYFIAFTENVRRPSVLKTGVPEAKTVNELRKMLNKLIK